MTDRTRAAGEAPVRYGLDTGRFPASRVEFWLREYASNPAATTAVIESMVALPEVCAAVDAGGAVTVRWSDGEDELFGHLFPASAVADEAVDPEFANLFAQPPGPAEPDPEFRNLFPDGGA